MKVGFIFSYLVKAFGVKWRHGSKSLGFSSPVSM